MKTYFHITVTAISITAIFMMLTASTLGEVGIVIGTLGFYTLMSMLLIECLVVSDILIQKSKIFIAKKFKQNA